MSKTAVLEPPTVKAVIAYAAKLVLAGDRQIAGDPYARPYRPPMDRDGEISEPAIRKLCQRVGSPEHALEYLRVKAAQADREAREQAQAAQRSLERHARRQAHHRRDLSRRRLELTPGQRIDQALAALSTISTVPAAVLDGDRVHGGERDQAPQWGGDPAGSARVRALGLAVELEAALDSARARFVQAA